MHTFVHSRLSLYVHVQMYIQCSLERGRYFDLYTTGPHQLSVSNLQMHKKEIHKIRANFLAIRVKLLIC